MKEIKKKSLTNKEVADFLLFNPDFLSKNPEILNSIEVIHETGGAVSLIQRQVEMLRKNYNSTTNNLLDLLSIAKANEEIFFQTKGLILDLIEADSIVKIAERIEFTFEKQFNATKCRLMFFKKHKDIPKGRFKDAKQSHDNFGDKYNTQDIYYGPITEKQATFLFGKRTKIIECALVPLRSPEFPGLIAIGSNIEGKYNTEKDTLFLDFIAEVTNKLIEKSNQ
ncbi:DUF484 family protein [Gammaproteobacteria bacterium]|nr:DUF484 family protein [Gammaproteobacteria bacterium]